MGAMGDSITRTSVPLEVAYQVAVRELGAAMVQIRLLEQRLVDLERSAEAETGPRSPEDFLESLRKEG